MSRSSFYALFVAVSVSALAFLPEAYGQSTSSSEVQVQVAASVTIIDGISVGIRKSHEGGSELWIEANDLRSIVMTRSEGKLFREYELTAIDNVATRPTREIAVAFE